MESQQYIGGYDYHENYNQPLDSGLKPRSEQDILNIRQKNTDRQHRLYISNIICIFIICTILYLIWYFTKNLSHDTLFIGFGIFFFICYILRHYIILALIALMLIPKSLIDNVPIDCVRTENRHIDCLL
jgi:hypothetical protein